MTTSTPRKRDGQARRRALCEAAIQVLAEHGSRGLTHQQVDRTAGMPDGTTSYYYRTRDALIRGVGQRVAEVDRQNLESLRHVDDAEQPFGKLAELVMMQSEGRGLMLNKARHELLLSATRDPELAEMSRDFVERVVDLSHDAIAGLQPASDDHALREAQSTAVTTFIAGVFARFAAGDRTIDGVATLARMLQCIVTAVALERDGTVTA